MKDPKTMTPAQINKELDRLEKDDRACCDAFITTGRGYEKPSEYLKKDDALSLEARRISTRKWELRQEIIQRYGPNAPSRLPDGFGRSTK